MTLILPPDMEAFLCDYLRSHITDVDGLQVGSKKPPDYQGAYPLVTVRDDGGNADGLGHFDRSIGVNVYGWSRQAEKPCKDLARRVYATLTEHPAIALAKGSPIISVDDSACNGPYPVSDDSDTAHYYLIVEYSTIGEH